MFHVLNQALVPGGETQAISGLAGIGKTHVAAEYARRFYKNYEAVIWLQAHSWKGLTSSCMKLADELGVPEREDADKVVTEIQHWLRKHRHWLLILDNVENPQENLPKFVPTYHQGSVLVTTRVHDVEPLAQTYVLSTMSEQEGALFLLRRTERIALKTNLQQASAVQYDEAKQVWQLMGGLPLALDQVGAYIREMKCSFSNYQELYTRRRAELLRQRGKRFIGHEESVATTFSLSFRRVEELSPMAADILEMCSLLHGEAIPEELLYEGMEHLSPRLTTEKDNWDQAIGVLLDYSLVQYYTDARTLTVHQLAQSVLKDAMSETMRSEWAELVVHSVNNVFPFPVGELSTWQQCERYLQQALACAEMVEQEHIMLDDAVSLLYHHVGDYLRNRCRYNEAEPLLVRALAISEPQWGLTYPVTESVIRVDERPGNPSAPA